MEIQDLLILVMFVFFWVISFLSKKVKSKPGDSQQKGFTLRVLQFIAELKEAGEREMNEPHVDSPQAATPVNWSKEEVEVVAEPVTPTLDPLQELKSGGDINNIVPPALARKAVVKPVVRKSGRKFCRKKLREAVVWAEIIGKPVALRENQ